MKIKYLMIVLVIVSSWLYSNETTQNITAQLTEKMSSSIEDEFIKVNIKMSADYGSRKMISETTRMAKQDKRDYVTSTLKEFSRNSQKELITQLTGLGSDVKNIKQLWLVNVVNCEMTKSAITKISNRTDIKSIDHDEKRNMLLAPSKNHNAEDLHEIRDGREITWNVTRVNADDVWDQGYYGAGVVVAVLDTGVNYNHNDLSDHVWNHPDYPNHGYDFINNDNNPMDDHGHGTHCSGTVAGDGTAGSQTGMAPEATIMCIKLMDSTGNGEEAASWAAIEFAVDNGADVLSMSFGWQHSWGVDREGWRDAMNYALAADVFSAVAAGNEGTQTNQYPIPDNVRTPGDCPPPWLHPDQTIEGGLSSVVCIGATNSSDNLASFSGRGPVTWENVTGYNDYAYNPGIGLIRPDISAPGDNIKSLAHYSNTGYEDGWSGTSMATPGAAGVIALMLSKNYLLTPAEIDQIIEETVAVAQNPKNNNMGSGRIDALAAVNAIVTPNEPPNQVINPNPADNAGSIPVNTNLNWMNGGGAASYEVFFGTDLPPTNIVNGEVVTSSNYSISENLDFETTYYWSVNAINEFGTATGSIWSFTTGTPADEDFETGNFSAFPWEFGGNQDWIVQTSEVYEGTYSAKSGDIGSNSTSELIIEMDVEEAGIISFYTKISCEEDSNDNWDYMAFYINNAEQERWDGEVSWSYRSYNVSPGDNTFKWKYLKDGNVDEGGDCAWLDYITFPAISSPIPILQINPDAYNFSMMSDEIETGLLTIENVGAGIGEYTIDISGQASWITLDSYAGDVAAGETDSIELTINTQDLIDGEYTGGIVIYDNRDVTTIPVNLVISNVDADDDIVKVTELIGNYPNPFNPTTQISYTLAIDVINADILIYNTKGQLVESIAVDNTKTSVSWDAEGYSSGIYFYKLSAGTNTQMKKMLLMK